jgi:hypothetical protein
MKKDIASFRKMLVERIAFESRFARLWVSRGRDEELAKAIGVAPEIIDEAAGLLRSGALKPEATNLGVASVSVFLPYVLAVPLGKMVEEMNMGHGQLLRSLLHMLMQTSREPTPRTPRKWGSNGKNTAFEWRGAPVSTQTGMRKHYEVMCRPALASSIGKRAAAYGVTRPRYIMLWVLDLIEGNLADMAIEPVTIQQTFDNEAYYVLPSAQAGCDTVASDDAEPDDQAASSADA